MKFIRNKSSVPENPKLNNNVSASPESFELAKVQKSIYMKAGLALLTVVLTVVILFAMTSAWYTNIVHTSGLMFEVEPWGFSGEVVVDQNPIKAGPGDSGTVNLKVLRNSQEENEEGEVSAILDEEASVEISTDIIDVDITIDKSIMAETIQQRIFFYVDSSAVINGEKVEKIYVNNKENYVYALFGGSDLIISEEASNVPELKWEWVYDVLGYYVYGIGVEENGTVVSVSNPEYLRPIEYDLDKATFDENTYELLTVDGTTTPTEFLNSVFESDGYVVTEGDGYTGYVFGENEIIESKKYYPVKVDENGTGVYAYICDYFEINSATDFDTNLGNLAYQAAQKDSTLTEEQMASLRFEAKITVSAQEREIVPVEVSSYEELLDAMESQTAEAVKLTKDISLGENYLDLSGKELTIDLNGNTLSGNGRYLIRSKDGSVTLLNGKMEGKPGTDKKSYAVYSWGESVFNASGVVVSGNDYGFCICDDTVSKIVGCTITSDQSPLIVYGNDSSDETKKLNIIIENSTFVSENGVAIMGNGSKGSWGTEISVINSTITGNKAAVYQPQNYSSMTIYKSTLEGNTGVVIKGGSVEIIDSTVTGTGSIADNPTAPASGFSDTGDAVLIETNYGYDINLEVTDGILNAVNKNSEIIRIYPEKTNVKVKIVSGIFSKAITNPGWVAAGSELLSEGLKVQKKSAE